jgi:CHAT domain-containing protein
VTGYCTFSETTASREDNGMLFASEISEMNFKDTRLAILSACDSGRVLRLRMGPFGPLVQGFLASGVRTILATQWPLDSKAAHDLMGRFAEQAIGGGTSVNAALRESARHLRADAEYAHPYFWAPFVYIGVAR